MRHWWVVPLVLLLASGCSGVVLNGEFSARLDSYSAAANVDAASALAGRLDTEGKVASLARQAGQWREFDGAAGVWPFAHVCLNAEYTALLGRTVAISAETAQRAMTGEFDGNSLTTAVVVQAAVWRLFQDARDGRAEQ